MPADWPLEVIQDNVNVTKSITIPSIFISFSGGAFLKHQMIGQTDTGAYTNTINHLDENNNRIMMSDPRNVDVSIDWRMASTARRDIVDWTIWSSTFDSRYSGFEKKFPLDQFAWFSDVLGSKATFTPHYFVIPGSIWYDETVNKELQCHKKYPACGNSCTNRGRYCLPDPDGDTKKGISAQDVLVEDLRQICIFKWANSTNQVSKWWDYVLEFKTRCKPNCKALGLKCSTELQRKLNINTSVVQMCALTSSGTNWGQHKNCKTDPDYCNAPNKLFDAEIALSEKNVVMQTPTVYVNGQKYTGRNDCPLPLSLRTCGLIGFICSGFKQGSRPPACTDSFWKNKNIKAQHTLFIKDAQNAKVYHTSKVRFYESRMVVARHLKHSHSLMEETFGNENMHVAYISCAAAVLLVVQLAYSVRQRQRQQSGYTKVDDTPNLL